MVSNDYAFAQWVPAATVEWARQIGVPQTDQIGVPQTDSATVPYWVGRLLDRQALDLCRSARRFMRDYAKAVPDEAKRQDGLEAFLWEAARAAVAPPRPVMRTPRECAALLDEAKRLATDLARKIEVHRSLLGDTAAVVVDGDECPITLDMAQLLNDFAERVEHYKAARLDWEVGPKLGRKDGRGAQRNTFLAHIIHLAQLHLGQPYISFCAAICTVLLEAKVPIDESTLRSLMTTPRNTRLVGRD